jgi:hypothetical protein
LYLIFFNFLTNFKIYRRVLSSYTKCVQCSSEKISLRLFQGRQKVCRAGLVIVPRLLQLHGLFATDKKSIFNSQQWCKPKRGVLYWVEGYFNRCLCDERRHMCIDNFPINNNTFVLKRQKDVVEVIIILDINFDEYFFKRKKNNETYKCRYRLVYI